MMMREWSGYGWRTCDSACHRAKEPKCTCVCVGLYHGLANKPMSQWPVELQQAMYDDEAANGKYHFQPVTDISARDRIAEAGSYELDEGVLT